MYVLLSLLYVYATILTVRAKCFHFVVIVENCLVLSLADARCVDLVRRNFLVYPLFYFVQHVIFKTFLKSL